MRRLAPLFGLAILLTLGVVVARTFRLPSAEQGPVATREVPIPSGAAERLAGAIRFPTISYEDAASFDPAPFKALHI